MDKNERIGLIGGIGGSILGATLWLVILGIVIKSTLLIILPVIFGIICFYTAMWSYNRRPERKLSIIGLAIIWLVFWNMLLCNYYYTMIPQNIGSITTGKEQFSLVQVNVMFIIFFLVGCGMVLRDIVKVKSQ